MCATSPQKRRQEQLEEHEKELKASSWTPSGCLLNEARQVANFTLVLFHPPPGAAGCAPFLLYYLARFNLTFPWKDILGWLFCFSNYCTPITAACVADHRSVSTQKAGGGGSETMLYGWKRQNMNPFHISPLRSCPPWVCTPAAEQTSSDLRPGWNLLWSSGKGPWCCCSGCTRSAVPSRPSTRTDGPETNKSLAIVCHRAGSQR